MKRLLCCLSLLAVSVVGYNVKVTDLRPDEVIYVSGQRNAIGFDVKSLNVFCWTGQPKLISHYFETAHLHLHIEKEDFVQYQGPDVDAVLQDIEDKKSLFSFNLLWSTQRDRVPLNVFNNTCIGVETAQEYRVVLQLIRYDTAKLACLVLGVLLLLVSGRLSENSLFFYICGVSFGVAASFLILVYFVSKVFPRKALMYGTLVCGWTLVFYFGQMVWQNLQMLAQTYGEYLTYYCLFTGLVSFVICYRYGPPTDRRSKNLIKWGLQAMALVGIWCSTCLKEAAVVGSILLLAVYYSPKCSVGSWRLWPRSKKPRLISVEEYERQGAIETAKALDDLKRFCSSPECNQWRTISRLKNPNRFASFIEGDSHVKDSEIIDHETSVFSEDEDSDENNDHRHYDPDSNDDNSDAGDHHHHLLSEEDDHEPTPRRSNGSVRRETPLTKYASGGQRKIIVNSRFRAERTPPIRTARHTPQSRRRYHLSDED